MKDILIIIPAFNEEAIISKVIKELSLTSNLWDILVVNDCSTDNTSQIVRETEKAYIIDLPNNLGIGGAVQTGFLYAYQNNYSIALQFDGDGQHNADEIQRLIKPILDGESEVVIGSRFINNKAEWRSSLPRRIGIFYFKLLNAILIGQIITDNTSGFRAYNRKAIEFLSDYYPTDYPEPEAVILLKKNKFKISEIPVRMNKRETGKSSINLPKSVYYMIKVTLAILITSLRKRKEQNI